MRNALRLAVFIAVPLGLLAQFGCAGQDRVETQMPASEEAPRLANLERKLPIRIGVQGNDRQPKNLIVTKMDPPPHTPAEKKALGEDEGDPELLRLYQPQKTLAQGVTPRFGGMQVGRASTSGGTAVGFVAPVTRYGIVESSSGGVSARGAALAKPKFGANGPAVSTVQTGSESMVRTGVNPTRRVADHHRTMAP